MIMMSCLKLPFWKAAIMEATIFHDVVNVDDTNFPSGHWLLWFDLWKGKKIVQCHPMELKSIFTRSNDPIQIWHHVANSYHYGNEINYIIISFKPIKIITYYNKPSNKWLMLGNVVKNDFIYRNLVNGLRFFSTRSFHTYRRDHLKTKNICILFFRVLTFSWTPYIIQEQRMLLSASCVNCFKCFSLFSEFHTEMILFLSLS